MFILAKHNETSGIVARNKVSGGVFKRRSEGRVWVEGGKE